MMSLNRLHGARKAWRLHLASGAMMACLGVATAFSVPSNAAIPSHDNPPPPAHGAAASPQVTVESGTLVGVRNAEVDRFLGIPYAAPPVGPLRWRPPEPARKWHGTLQATNFAPFCAESSLGVFASNSTSEDCLYLNVFAPQGTSAASGAVQKHRHDDKRPVMVWFYGGGLFSGESNDYDASLLARRGDVVVVTLNYRVGVFGFFSHPAINAEGHPFANYGIMDQQSALRWVQRNIEQFGGDPRNVTIFGQSGGATAVMANLVSPTASGLFQRAINESGTHIEPYPAATALTAGKSFADATGCTDQSAACLRSLSVSQILANQTGIITLVRNNFVSIDGTVITEDALPAFRAGHFAQVPILTGLVRDEQAFFLPEITTGQVLTAADYATYLASFGQDNVARLSARYPLANYASPSLAEIAAAQGFKVCTARRLDRAWTRYVPVYAYQFDNQTSPSYFPPTSYPMRAYHTVELQYLFPGFHGGRGTPQPLTEPEQRLSDTLVDYWTNFARWGTPNSRNAPTSHVPPWRAYDVSEDNYQSFNIPVTRNRTGYGARYDCGLWKTVFKDEDAN